MNEEIEIKKDEPEKFSKILEKVNNSSETNKKILLMGNRGVGKSSILNMIYFKSSQIDTYSLESTELISVNGINFIGINYNLIECGGKEKYKKFYFDNASKLFSKVNKLIFVIEAEDSGENKEENNNNEIKDYNNSLDYYEKCLQYLEQYSPNCKVFVLINKIDLINITRKKQVINKRKQEIRSRESNFEIKCFPTSIWEIHELKKSWGEILINELNFDRIKNGLNLLKENLKSRKIVIFENFTFLKICSVNDDNFSDNFYDYFDEMIIMHIKNIYDNLQNEKLKEIEIDNENNIILIKEFTPSTLIYLIFDKPCNHIELTKLNISLVKNEFIKILDNYQTN